jgi:hypothetical protein
MRSNIFDCTVPVLVYLYAKKKVILYPYVLKDVYLSTSIQIKCGSTDLFFSLLIFIGELKGAVSSNIRFRAVTFVDKLCITSGL